MTQTTAAVEAAYQHCLGIARGHYENFPVASWLLPRRLRLPVAALYAFARRADDLADEGELSDQARLEALQAMAHKLDHAQDAGEDPVFVALHDSLNRFALPVDLLHDLLRAFTQDVNKKRYASFGEVMDYCRRSANPIGRLLLHLNDDASEENLAYSDAICSALQLINFYQDLRQDYQEMGRIYLPQDEMQRFGVSEAHLREGINDEPMRRLMLHQITRADRLLRAGAPLGRRLRGRFGLEIRLIVMAAARIVFHLRQQQDWFSRPRLKALDGLYLLKAAVLPR